MGSDFNELRVRALEVLSSKAPIDPAICGNDVKRLIEELSVHQIELEFQNEELIKAQNEIQRTSDQYAELFNNAPIGYIIIDNARIIVAVNDTFCTFAERERIDLVGNPIDRYISPLYQDSFYHFFRLLKTINCPSHIEIKMCFPHGAESHVSINGIYREGDSDLYRLTVSDISFQKKLEERLRLETEKAIKNETYFRQIIERSSDIFYYQNINTKLFDYISPTVRHILGYSQDECLDMTVKNRLGLILPQYRDMFLNITEELIEAGNNGKEIVVHELEMYTKSNRKKWIRGNYTLIRDCFGRPFQIMGTLQDITNDKQYETLLLHARNEAETKANFKSSFLANISHEIRTPLNAVIGFSNLIQENPPDNMDRECLEYINIIHENGERLLKYFNDIIHLSKVEAHQMEVRRSIFDFNQFLHKMYNIFMLDAKEKNLSLECTNGTDPLMVCTDIEIMESCVQNLIKNALKYTQKGFVRFGAHVTDNRLHFYVTDSGIGIAKDNQKILFDRFQQMDNSLSQGGVGLGLNLVKGLITLLAGEIELESEPGKGSTFSFSVPLSGAESIKE